MKKLLIFLVFPLITVFGQIQPVVDINGKLHYPSTSTFKIANDIASDSTTLKKENIYGLRFVIDTSPTISIEAPYTSQSSKASFSKPYYINSNGIRTATTTSSGGTLSTQITYYRNRVNIRYWSDCEIKAIRKSDGELCYWISSQQGKTSSDYLTHSARDAGAKIFFTASGTNNDGRNWIERNDSTYSSNYENAMAISTMGYFIIGGIIIEPDLTNPQVAEIFSNPELYNFIYIKIDPASGVEKDTMGCAIWRPITPILTLKK